MSRVWFAEEVETVATWWRILRRDGVTLGFTSHDGDLWFDGVLHRAAPGMMPAAIRRSSDFADDSAEVDGAIAHDTISACDLEAGRYDGATVIVGLVDWETLQQQAVYAGSIGSVSEEAGKFTATLASRKADLKIDPIPRTSPCCRADFCGKGCGLSAPAFTHEAMLSALDQSANTATFTLATGGTLDAGKLIGGEVRWLAGPYAGLAMGVMAQDGNALLLDNPVDQAIAIGTRALLREGCDHTLDTCAQRFANAANFQGEPFLPGNDLIVRYGLSS
ncbi:MAG TPA: DUF2163 domain-containing protein [Novosphingobium sp.]|nr:DUF2163 domain-containing protein [Novosphingobium sp.]